jgi:small multidrug resistance pump
MVKGKTMTSIILVCALYLLLAAVGMVLIKSGHSAKSILTIPYLNVSLSVRIILGILFYGMSFLVFTFYISRLNIGIAIPLLSGFGSVIMVIIGYLLFKEHITTGQFAGIGLIVVGTVLVGIFK